MAASVFSKMLTYPVRHEESEVFFIGNALSLGLCMGHVAERLVVNTVLDIECLLVFLDVKATSVDYEPAILTRYGQDSELVMRDFLAAGKWWLLWRANHGKRWSWMWKRRERRK